MNRQKSVKRQRCKRRRVHVPWSQTALAAVRTSPRQPACYRVVHARRQPAANKHRQTTKQRNPLFIALCVPLILGIFRKPASCRWLVGQSVGRMPARARRVAERVPAAQPSNAPPGKCTCSILMHTPPTESLCRNGSITDERQIQTFGMA